MDRRKFIKTGVVATTGAMTVPVLFPKDTKVPVGWFLAYADPTRHYMSNHIYSMLHLIPQPGRTGPSEHTQFTVGGKDLAADKVYEYLVDDKFVIWCKPVDYNLLQKMKDKVLFSVYVISGLSSPYNLQIRNAALPIDGYEVHFLHD